MNTKRKLNKRRKSQKGGYKYTNNQNLDSLSEEIKSSSSTSRTYHNKNKTRKRTRHKSRK